MKFTIENRKLVRNTKIANNLNAKMGCSHYLQVIYGVICTKFWFLQKYEINSFEDLIDFKIQHKDKCIEVFSLKKHGFYLDNKIDEKIILGIAIGEILDIGMIYSLQKYNEFFPESPKIHSILSGCSCCT